MTIEHLRNLLVQIDASFNKVLLEKPVMEKESSQKKPLPQITEEELEEKVFVVKDKVTEKNS